MGLSITVIIIGITAIISFIAFSNRQLMDAFLHHPVSVFQKGQWYRLLSSGFLHGNTTHLFMNMFMLWMFGQSVEGYYSEFFGGMGPLLFVALYLIAIVASDLPTAFKHKNNPQFASLGASGATSAILYAFALINPAAPLQFIFFPFFDIPAIVVIVGFTIYEYIQGKRGGTGINHAAHLYGGLFGVVFTLILKPDLLFNFFGQIKSLIGL